MRGMLFTWLLPQQEEEVLMPVCSTKIFHHIVIKTYLVTDMWQLIVKLQWWKDMMPFDQMTMDDYKDYFPDPKLDIYETPSFWPHNEPPRPVFPYLEKKDH
ncbi:ATP synthase subunit d, mitochondrial [Caerostris extrusa]|uniref:ATP synthase subunit d, mitochondrial n=1 Tax=Caerostris extrusa TaxID=172846 RepID=A0AAV4X908_CAEEX|nr:ATP synthase subunit d, mitochondrial [Caerostris extrusa]